MILLEEFVDIWQSRGSQIAKVKKTGFLAFITVVLIFKKHNKWNTIIRI